MHLLPLVRTVHIAAGAAALTTFWIPLVAPKGGWLHRKSGWAYVIATAIASATGAALAISYLLDDRPANDAPGLFLLYVGLLGATCASMGVRVLRTKQRTRPHRNVYDLGLPSALLAGGIGLGALGLARGMPLFVVFAALGVFLAFGQLRFWLRPPATRTQWLLEHMSGMGGSCITTVTAFLVVNAQRMGFGTFDVLVWVAPGVLGSVGFGFWQRRWRARLET